MPPPPHEKYLWSKHLLVLIFGLYFFLFFSTKNHWNSLFIGDTKQIDLLDTLLNHLLRKWICSHRTIAVSNVYWTIWSHNLSPKVVFLFQNILTLSLIQGRIQEFFQGALNLFYFQGGWLAHVPIWAQKLPAKP